MHWFVQIETTKNQSQVKYILTEMITECGLINGLFTSSE